MDSAIAAIDTKSNLLGPGLTTPAWLGIIATSTLAHISFLMAIEAIDLAGQLTSKPSKVSQVKVSVVEKPENPPSPVPEIPKPNVVPKKKPLEKIKKIPALAPKEQTQAPEEVKPIQGLSKDSLAAEGKGGFSAPVGNTLMVEDTGTRVDSAADLTTDLSEDAKLIPESLVKPDYTDDALDAGIEGVFPIDVFVDETGAVSEVEIRKKVGFGMDERIEKSVRTAKFVPRKDSMGKPIEGWAVINFRLTIP